MMKMKMKEHDQCPVVNGCNGSRWSTLHDITFSLEKGSLTAVVGLVGSGKSSLLNSILKRFSNQRQWFWIGVWSALVACLGILGFFVTYLFGVVATSAGKN